MILSVQKNLRVMILDVEKPLDISKYREIFKSGYTRAVMSGAGVQEGISAGARAVRKVIGDDDQAFEVMVVLRACLGDVLGIV